MCLSSPKAPPPPPPPPPPAPPVKAPELDTVANEKDTASMKKGRQSLRIDLANNAPTEGTGLNIPQ
jgi:hypothetical protein